MRWRYFDPSNLQEAAEREAMLARIDAFWSAFVSRIPDIQDLMAQRHQWDLAGWMNQALHPISPDLMWEVGVGSAPESPSAGQGLRLVITPEAQSHLRPLVDVILARAPGPAEALGWAFYSHRLPEPYSLARQSVLARTGTDIDTMTAEACIGENNQIDLIYHPGAEFGTSATVGLLASEALLGEKVLESWIGQISVRPAASGMGMLVKAFKKTNAKPLTQLSAMVAALVQSRIDQLPHEPVFMCNRVNTPELRKCEHAVMRICSGSYPEPPGLQSAGPQSGVGQYPGVSDVFLAVSEDARLWYAQHKSGRFESARFSRFGEVFCYLKLDDAGVPPEARADKRFKLHQVLDQALITAELGCVTGGATGLCYTYLDLALMDFEKAVPVIRAVLRQAGVGRESWIMLSDAALADEWVGVYDHTPAPPR